MRNRLLTETVVLVRRGEPTGDYDADGKPVFGPDSRSTEPAWYEPRGATENVDAQSQQIWGYWVYLPQGTSLDAVDTVEIMGEEYEVDGQPGVQPPGFIVHGFVAFAAKRSTG